MATYRVHEGSLNERFLKSRKKIQFFGGGFANGKTASACIRALELARDYPGSNGLIARSTYPKLNDTIRKEFLKWCPDDWIKSFPKSANGSNTCALTNGTTVNFRYIQQQGKSSQESTTSNLLSATYDWIIVDQMEDPEIVHKDFLDLLGRLRGMTKYTGEDDTMPKTGPRWFIITSNPTRNWVYKKLIKPIHDLQKGVANDDLLCEEDENGNIILDDNGRPTPLIDLYEGSTYENKANLESDFIKMLETAYTGQMRDRYLLGRWASYEGLVYPSFMEEVHVMSHHSIVDYYNKLYIGSQLVSITEGYDYGMAVPYCYILGFTDDKGNVFLMDGDYEKEIPISSEYEPFGQVERIKQIRQKYRVPEDNLILADPSIFRRSPAKGKLVGKSVSTMFMDDDIVMTAGNNDISNGIAKVTQYLAVQKHHQNPITGVYNSPHLYISDRLEFLIDEINGYYWQTDTVGDTVEKPVDKNDHAMDTLKYMLTHNPEITVLTRPVNQKQIGWRKWGEREIPADGKDIRHG